MYSCNKQILKWFWGL